MKTQNEPSREQLKAYQRRMAKLLERFTRVKLTDEEREMLDRAVRESRQCPEDKRMEDTMITNDFEEKRTEKLADITMREWSWRTARYQYANDPHRGERLPCMGCETPTAGRTVLQYPDEQVVRMTPLCWWCVQRPEHNCGIAEKMLEIRDRNGADVAVILKREESE